MTFSEVVKRARRKPLFVAGETTRAVNIGRAEIERLLPHRDPMLLVDQITAVDLQQQVLRAHRWIDPQDPVFAGHFPENPVYPGALLVEAMGQASVCLHQLLELDRLDIRPEDRPQPLRLLRVHHALFLSEVLPGDELDLLCKRLESDSYAVVCAAQVTKGETICALAVMEVFLAEGEA